MEQDIIVLVGGCEYVEIGVGDKFKALGKAIESRLPFNCDVDVTVESSKGECAMVMSFVGLVSTKAFTGFQYYEKERACCVEKLFDANRGSWLYHKAFLEHRVGTIVSSIPEVAQQACWKL